MRMEIEIAEGYEGLIDDLKKVTGDNYSRLFNEAVTLLNWAVRQRKEGRVIASVDDKGETYRELSLPALDKIVPATPATPPATT